MSGAADPVGAAAEAAKRHGVSAEGARLIHTGVNAVVDLGSVPVVARVMTTTAEIRGERAQGCAERDLAIVRHLLCAGAPVVPPSDLLPAGPHRSNGLILSFWKRVDHDPNRAPDPTGEGNALRRIHEALLSFDGALPRMHAVAEVPEVLRALVSRGALSVEDSRSLQANLEAELQAIESSGLPTQALHGDAHLRNVLRTPEGPLWCDFEDTGEGPIEWDLACLVASRRAFGGTHARQGEAALEAHGAPSDSARLSPFLRARALQSIAWGFVVAGEADAERRRLAASHLDWWKEVGRRHFAR